MKRYNLTAKILANVAVQSTSITAARLAIQEKLKGATQLIDLLDFVIEHAEITGIFDINWNELDMTPPDPRPLPRPGPQPTPPPFPVPYPGPSPRPPGG